MNLVSPGAAGEPLQPPANEPRGNKKRLNLGDYTERFALIGAWIVVIVVFSILAPTTFFNVQNFTTMFGTQTTLVILALALLIPLSAGDYDLSVAATLTFAGMVVAVLNGHHGWPIGLTIVIALAVGAGIGLMNGFFVMVFDIDPFIVTLGTGTVISGITLWISGSQTISGVSGWLSNWVVNQRLFGISLEFYYGLLVCLFLWYIFEYTAIGRRILFVGRGRNVARLSGIRVGRVRWGCFIAAGVIAAAAGVLYTGTAGAADPTSGGTFLLPAFAAAFLGGTTITPGRFNPWGTFIAVYFLVTGITGLAILGVQTWVQNVFYGGALVVAVSASQVVKKRHERAARLS
jgi:ribose transport system permease protein